MVKNALRTVQIYVVEDLVQFGPKVHFRVYLDYFYNYPGPFWAGLRGLTNTQPLSLIYKYNICIL